jgi:dipeptidyl aminopeptidase/acylaminoacyl peptidase
MIRIALFLMLFSSITLLGQNLHLEDPVLSNQITISDESKASINRSSGLTQSLKSILQNINLEEQTLALSTQNPIIQDKQVMTPELLWSLGRVSALSVSPDGEVLLYRVSRTDLKTENSDSEFFIINLTTNHTQKTDILKDKSFIQWDKNGMYARKGNELLKSTDQGETWNTISSNLEGAIDIRISADGRIMAFSKEVLVNKVLGKEIYPDVPNTTAHIYTDLDYRHWDKWNDGKVNHVFLINLDDPTGNAVDLLEGKPYNTPQKPFGGSEDFIFSPDSKSILYVTKEKVGKEYAQSTNTDIFQYVIETGITSNLTEGMMGYDVSPKISPDGKRLAWLSMENDGYEADKNDIVIMDFSRGYKLNITAAWDETVDGDFRWSNDGKNIYFSASNRGTKALYAVGIPANLKVRMLPLIQQVASGPFNINDIIAENKGKLIIGRTDFNHATEYFSLIIKNGTMDALTKVNEEVYSQVKMSNAELQMVTTKDGNEMGVWVIYPPDFDPTKRYPTLLYCQGGPQSALTQSYSLRWNFQLMAANGYIIVAPNRRGMPGWGVEWNEAISKDWGGAVMQDYLDAIDEIAKEPFVDNDRLGCVGASYGGYSAFMLAGIHENRFKTIIAHDGLFDMKSWYGTTEELFFANWDLGGNYWDSPTPEAYTKFNPSNYVAKWNTPIFIIQGELDYRVPIGQGLQAFQAAQLRGIKSKLLYYPNENHWVLHPHNGLVWQREFFNWLKETL